MKIDSSLPHILFSLFTVVEIASTIFITITMNPHFTSHSSLSVFTRRNNPILFHWDSGAWKYFLLFILTSFLNRFGEYKICAHVSLCIFMDIKVNLPGSCLNIMRGPSELYQLQQSTATSYSLFSSCREELLN